ncbi:MAG: Wadjet anti-phage system protein JetD domain-containing protein [Verrucomicrobiales bacterium]
MNTRADFLKQAERRYHDFLRATVSGHALFPMPVTLGKSSRAETYDARRAELVQFRKDAASLGLEVEWETVEERRFGRHERPKAAYFPDEAAYLKALGKAREVAWFREECARILARFPDLKSWVESQVTTVLRELGNWERLLDVVHWLQANPASGLYLRQLPVIGMDTKFMESRFALLDVLLAYPSPPSSEGDFRNRWGLRAEEPMVRMRFLDPEVRRRCGFPECADDLALPTSQVARLPLDGALVIMVENLRNFLALPLIHGAVAAFGSGDALAHWRQVTWLRSATCLYWGDLDAHGFALLARLRQFLPHAHSLLMNPQTLEQYRSLAVPDQSRPPAFEAAALRPDEFQAFATVSRDAIRLEQERLPMPAVHQAIEDWRRAGDPLAATEERPSKSWH